MLGIIDLKTEENARIRKELLAVNPENKKEISVFAIMDMSRHQRRALGKVNGTKFMALQNIDFTRPEMKAVVDKALKKT